MPVSTKPHYGIFWMITDRTTGAGAAAVNFRGRRLVRSTEQLDHQRGSKPTRADDEQNAVPVERARR